MMPSLVDPARVGARTKGMTCHADIETTGRSSTERRRHATGPDRLHGRAYTAVRARGVSGLSGGGGSWRGAPNQFCRCEELDRIHRACLRSGLGFALEMSGSAGASVQHGESDTRVGSGAVRLGTLPLRIMRFDGVHGVGG